MAHKPNIQGNKESEQNILNWSFDKDYGVLVFEKLGFDGVSVSRDNAENLALKITESGDIKYVASAAPGTDQATATKQIADLEKQIEKRMVGRMAKQGVEKILGK